MEIKMRKTDFTRFLFLLTCCLVLAACKTTVTEEDFTKQIKIHNVENVNQDLEISFSPYRTTILKIGTVINLLVTNKSNRTIRFPADGNLQVFLYLDKNHDWVSIENDMNYHGTGAITVPVSDIGIHDQDIFVKPIIENDGSAKRIRVVVTGIVVENDVETDRAVSAYMDLTLQP
jgi:hypothetical protein